VFLGGKKNYNHKGLKGYHKGWKGLQTWWIAKATTSLPTSREYSSFKRRRKELYINSFPSFLRRGVPTEESGWGGF
jgi:hypothetical protein